MPRLIKAHSGTGTWARSRPPPKNAITSRVRWAASPRLRGVPSSRRIFKPSRALPGVVPQKWSMRISPPVIRNSPSSEGSREPVRTKFMRAVSWRITVTRVV